MESLLLRVVWADALSKAELRFGSLACQKPNSNPLLQIRLNSRGLIYSVGLLLASVFVTVSWQLSPRTCVCPSFPPLGFFGDRMSLASWSLETSNHRVPSPGSFF